MTIKGGFAGTGEPDPNARDIVRFESVLSGDLWGVDLDVNTPEGWLSGRKGPHSERVVIGSGTDASTPCWMASLSAAGVGAVW